MWNAILLSSDILKRKQTQRSDSSLPRGKEVEEEERCAGKVFVREDRKEKVCDKIVLLL